MERTVMLAGLLFNVISGLVMDKAQDLATAHVEKMIDSIIPDAAKKELDTVMSKGGREHGNALSSLALFESLKGDEKKTLDLIEDAMEADGKSIDVLLRAYKIFTKLGDPKKANRVLDALQDIAPDDPRVMGLLLA